MSEVLSQNEVDALLAAISEEDVSSDGRTTPKWMSVHTDVNRYDFARQHQQIFRGQTPTLRAIYTRFASMVKTTLGAVIGKNIYINLSSIRMENFEEFLSQLPRPTSFHIFQVDALKCSAILSIEGPLAYTLLESSLGGGGLSTGTLKTEGRELTIIEQKLISRIALEILPDLEKAWQPIIPIKAVYTRTETNPQFIDIISSASMIVTASFDLRLDQPLGLLHITMPQDTLKLQEMREGSQKEDREYEAKLTKRIKEVSTKVIAELGQTKISTYDLLNLKRGDIITLDAHADQDVIMKIEGVPKLKGRLGVSKGNIAVQVSSKITG